MKKVLTALVLSAAIAGAGCASGAKQAREPTVPIISPVGEKVLFEKKTYGTQMVNIRITKNDSIPYCTSLAGGIDCYFSEDFITMPVFDFMTQQEARHICRYAMRHTFASYADINACAFELMQIKVMELAPPAKNQ
ncbi:hypothetical protein JW711_02035 [Candidatus Woesearchaeota archaeon]|nr:hypothetical protein [Candidatus Woesearchaeota archaeon]